MRTIQDVIMGTGRWTGPLVLLLLAAGLGGCAQPGLLSPQRYATREQAFKLIDEGRAFTRQNAPLLALERFNRAALLYDSPEAYYEMGALFEQQDKPEQAATAFGQALTLAPDFQQAKLAMLSLGYTPPGYEPTPEDLRLAEQLAQERKLEREKNQTQSAEVTAQEAAARAEAERVKREELIAEAAQHRLPTQAEIQSVVFSPESSVASLPSAENPTYEMNTDIILGTYAYHMQKARQLLQRQQFDNASEEYQRALEADPTQMEARLELGDMWLHQERSERARYHYEQAIQNFPDSARPLHKMGNYYLDINRPDDARRYYRLALDKDPGYLEAYNNLAVLDMREGKFEQARQLLNEMIKQDPEYANAYMNLGIIASDIDHQPAAAIENFRRYVSLGGSRAAEAKRWIQDLEETLPAAKPSTPPATP